MAIGGVRKGKYYKDLLTGFRKLSHTTIEVNACEGEPCVVPDEQGSDMDKTECGSSTERGVVFRHNPKNLRLSLPWFHLSQLTNDYSQQNTNLVPKDLCRRNTVANLPRSSHD